MESGAPYEFVEHWSMPDPRGDDKRRMTATVLVDASNAPLTVVAMGQSLRL